MSDAPSHAGQAYLVHPAAGAGGGPGVLVLHSWWGLTAGVKQWCDRLADQGFVVLAPDLMAGRRPETAAEAELELGASDPNVTAGLVLSSIVALRSQTARPDGPVSVVGFSMGASWALWVATRQPDSVDAVVAYYGTQHIDFAELRAPVLGHFGSVDDIVSPDDLVEMHAHLLLLEHDVEVFDYEGKGHFFAEADVEEAYDPDAAELAWERTVSFLKRATGHEEAG
jgi:carboxymethylenebutenolidase